MKKLLILLLLMGTSFTHTAAMDGAGNSSVKNDNEMNNMHVLPPEILDRIAGHLSARSLGQFSCVNNLFNKVAHDQRERLEKLDLSEANMITEALLKYMCQRLPKLKYLIMPLDNEFSEMIETVLRCHFTDIEIEKIETRGTLIRTFEQIAENAPKELGGIKAAMFPMLIIAGDLLSNYKTYSESCNYARPLNQLQDAVNKRATCNYDLHIKMASNLLTHVLCATIILVVSLGANKNNCRKLISLFKKPLALMRNNAGVTAVIMSGLSVMIMYELYIQFIQEDLPELQP